jgi:hypothetical protein
VAPHGLQPGWFDLLAALRRSGSPYELNPTELMRSTLANEARVLGSLSASDRRALDGLLPSCCPVSSEATNLARRLSMAWPRGKQT